MRKQLPRLAVAALTFALGVASDVPRYMGEDASVNVPEPPVSVPLVPPPAPPPETCELHHLVMRGYCLPVSEVLTLSTTLSGNYAEQKLFPNAQARRADGGVCVARGENALYFYACPGCRAAKGKWEAGELRP